MKPDCRNDCNDPVVFPKPIDNRPGLSQIRYRIGAYADFRDAIMQALNSSDVLAGWTHRESDDPGIALLEGAAVLGDILTMYQERYANEAFLRTAQWRESVDRLVRLTGYRLSPGVGGRATFAFEMKEGNPVVVPAGFPIKARLEGLDDPAEFESQQEITAYPALNQFHLYHPYQLANIDTGTQVFSIETAALNNNGLDLQPGDQLYIVDVPGNTLTSRQVVKIKSTKERFDRTEVEIEGEWQQGWAATTVKAYKLGRSFRHFGANAPPTFVTVENNLPVTHQTAFARALEHRIGFGSTEATLIDSGSSESMAIELINKSGFGTQTALVESFAFSNVLYMPVDAEVDDLSTGSLFLITLQLGGSSASVGSDVHFFERTVKSVKKASFTVGPLTGNASVVKINQTVSSSNLEYTDIRTVDFWEVIGPQFALKGAFEEKPASDAETLYFYGSAEAYAALQDRSLLLTKEDGTSESVSVTIDQTEVSGNAAVRLRPVFLPAFKEDFTLTDFPLLDDPTVTVYGNLVEADQGKTEREAILGNGDSRQTFQTFKLPKAPVTYHNIAGETPPEVPETMIYIDGRLWTPVPSLFDRGPEEEIYIIREDSNGDSYVQFGDGKTGRRLPTGLKNVKAIFRTGNGAYGPKERDTTVQGGARLDGLDKIQLPGIVTGGGEPESGDNARETAPGKVQSLGRLVSLQDFETESQAIQGVTRSRAAWELRDNVPTVVITVLMDTGREAELTVIKESLQDANRCRGMWRHPIYVVAGTRVAVGVSAEVAFDPAYREEDVRLEISAALGVTAIEETDEGLFSLKNRRFGQAEFATRITGAVQNVEGVNWVRITGLQRLPDPEHSPVPLALDTSTPCGPTEILTLHSDNLSIQTILTPASEIC